jgi:hypothetical protein
MLAGFTRKFPFRLLIRHDPPSLPGALCHIGGLKKPLLFARDDASAHFPKSVLRLSTHFSRTSESYGH